MAKYILSTFATIAVAVIGFASLPAAEAADACQHKSFKSELIKEACASGGQKAAKKAMKDFVKDAKKKQDGLDCESCHSSLSPKYELKSDAFERFKKLGGK